MKFLSISIATLITVLMSNTVFAQFTPNQALAADSFPFPGRAEDLPPGHYWFLQHEHSSGNKSQSLGYDLGAGVRFDVAQQKWVGTKPGASGDSCASAPKNSDCIIYGIPVYAIADGEVLSCWRNAPENPAPGKKRDDIGDWNKPGVEKGVPGGGNLLKVDQGNGQIVLYAHFIPGSVPKSLCPVDDEFQTPAQTGVLPPGNRPKVKKGQKIGAVGNSGSSSRPHLHIHMEGKAGEPLPLRFHSAWIKSTNKDEDSTTDWVQLKGEALSNPPIAILPNYSTGLSRSIKK